MKVDHRALGLIGIRADDGGTVLPAGNYLRWTPGKRVDLPLLTSKVTFALGRRPHRPPDIGGPPLMLRDADIDSDDSRRARLGPVSLTADRPVHITVNGLVGPGALTVTATFPEPVVAVAARLTGAPAGRGAVLLGDDSAGDTPVAGPLSATPLPAPPLPSPTGPFAGYAYRSAGLPAQRLRITIPAGGVLVSLHHTTERSDAERPGWTAVHSVLFPFESESPDALMSRLPAGLAHRFLAAGAPRGPIRDRLVALLDRLGTVVHPNDSIRAEPAPELPAELFPLADRVQWLERQGQRPRLVVRPLDELFLAALDPTVALLLGFAYADTTAPAGPHDYRIVGQWTTLTGEVAEEYAAVAYRIGAVATQAPAAPQSVGATPAGNPQWDGTTPFRRVDLRWQSGVDGPSTAVLFDVWRDGTPAGPADESLTGGAFLTERRPVLRRKVGGDAPDYLDRAKAAMSHTYRVRGIDLFGRVGPWRAVAIEVPIGSRPPVPTGIGAELVQPGHPWLTDADRAAAAQPARLTVEWQWRHTQHQQYPTVDRFAVWIRAETAVDSTEVELTPRVRAAGGWRVELRAMAGIADLGGFAGGELTALAADGSLPPVAKRRRLRLSGKPADFVGEEAVVLVGDDAPAPPPGRYRLTADPKNPVGWTKVATVPRLKAVTGPVQGGEPLRLEIVSATALAGTPGRFTVEFRPLATAGFVVPLASLLVGRELRQGGHLFVVLPGEGAAGADRGVPTSAAAADPPRLVVAGPASPALGVCEVAQLRRYRVQVASSPAYPPGTAGGQLVVSAPNARDPDSLEVVSAPTYSANQLTIWASSPSGTATSAVLPAATATYYPRQTLRTAGPDALRADPANPLRTGFVAVSALADSGEAGPLSGAAAVRAVPTPPDTPPSAPYPVAEPTADEWWASPADVHGQATVIIGWDPPAGQDRTLYWEVCRALDLSVVAADQACWQLGRGHYRPGGPDGPGRAAVLAALGPADAPVPVRITGAALQPDETTLLDTDPPLDAGAAARLARGALEVTRGATVSRFALISLVRSGSAYQLRVGRGLNADGTPAAAPSSGNAVLLPAPDYGPVLADDSLLRTLADLDGNESAFQVVTVSALVETRLTDRFPGRGRNRYLHRVRGVDLAGNRTPLSSTGPPVHLVDPRLPAAPIVLAAAGGRESATLQWRRDSDPEVFGYRLHRKLGDAVGPQDVGALHRTLAADSTIAGAEPLVPAPIRLSFGAVTLPTGTLDAAAVPSIQAVHIRNADGTVDAVTNYWVVDPTALRERRVVGFGAAAPDGTEVAVVLDGIDDTGAAQQLTITAMRPDRPLVVQTDAGARIIDLRFPYQIDTVLGVFAAADYDLTVDAASQPGANLFAGAAAFDPATARLTGVGGSDGTVVVVIVRETGSASEVMLLLRAGSTEALVVSGGVVALDLPINPTALVSAYRVDDPTHDLVLRAASTYDPTTRRLAGLDPALREAAPVAVVLDGPSGPQEIREQPDAWEVTDAVPAPPHRGQLVCYWLAAVRRVRHGRAPDAVLDVASAPSGPLRVTAHGRDDG